ncbi:hypothetical protein SLS64_013906 [Diaporthe eres]
MPDVPQLPTAEEDDDDGQVPMGSDAGNDIGELLEEQMDVVEGEEAIEDDEDEPSADDANELWLMLSTSRALNERFTFSTGDYMKHTRDSDNNYFSQIDHNLLLDNLHDRHVFIVLQPVRPTLTRHDVLDLEIMENLDKVAIIGIVAVQPVRLLRSMLD